MHSPYLIIKEMEVPGRCNNLPWVTEHLMAELRPELSLLIADQKCLPVAFVKFCLQYSATVCIILLKDLFSAILFLHQLYCSRLLRMEQQ